MKKKAIIISGIAVLVFGFGWALKAQNDYAQAEKSMKHEVLQTNEIYDKVKNLFDEKGEFLAKDLKQSDIDSLREEIQINSADVKKIDTGYVKDLLKEYKEADSKVTLLIDQAEDWLKIQTETNGLFSKNAMNGTEIQKDNVIKKDLKEKEITDLEEKLPEKDKDVPFTAKVRELTTTAKKQLSDVSAAEKEIEAALKNKNQENLDKAVTLVNKVKNEDIKKSLNEKLSPVKEEVKKAAEEKKAKEESNKNAAGSSEQQSQEAASGSTSEEVASASGGSDNTYTNNANTGGSGGETGGYTPPVNNNGSGSGGGGQSQTPTPEQPQQPSNPGTGGGSGGGTPTPPTIQEPAAGNGGWFGSEGACVAAMNAAIDSYLAQGYDVDQIKANHWWAYHPDGSIKYTYNVSV